MVYFINLLSKKILDSGTVPKDKKIPYIKQLPPRTIFEDKMQYMVAIAIRNSSLSYYCRSPIPPPIGLDSSQDLAVDAGAQISPADFDKVDQSVAFGLIKLTAKQRQAATAAAVSQRPKVLLTSGINTAVDELVPRFMSIVKTILGKLGLDLICLRMHLYRVEAKDFPRLTAKLGREIERENNDVTSSFSIRLLSKFSGEVDAIEREGRKNRRPNPSVVDKAIELYNADQEGPQETPLRSLSVMIDTRGRTSTVQTSILLQ